MSTLELTAHDAGFAMLVDDSEYKYLVNSNSEPFAYFLNPAVYGSGSAFVHYDAATDSWTINDVPTFQHLDDRYGVGADYVSNFYGRPPFGSNLPGIFVPLDSSDNLVDIRDETEIQNLRLTKAYTSAVIVPYLVVKVYEQRLASYTYYTYLGSPLGDGSGGTVDSQNYLPDNKDTLIETMALELESALQAGGDLYTAYETFTGLQLQTNYDAPSRTLEISNMARFDGHEIEGERFGEITTGHMMRPDIVVPGLTKVVGHEYYGFKPMRGVYTVFAPEKLNDLMKVVEDTIDTLNSPTDDQKAALRDALGYHWYDFFRGQDQTIRVEVPEYLAPRTTLASGVSNGDGTISVTDSAYLSDDGVVTIGGTEFAYTSVNRSTHVLTLDSNASTTHSAGDTVLQPYNEIRANLFMSAHGSQLVGATVSLEDPDNPGTFFEVANSYGVNLSDSFSHYDEEFYNAKPAARRLTTGPYGAQGIVNDDGTITWLSDGYSV